MKLAELLSRNPDTLPYFITETQSGNPIPVRFEQLTEEDRAELQGEVWAGAVFAAVWPQFIGDEQTRKLVCVSPLEARIQGLVRIGKVASGSGVLTKSLLATALFNRQEMQWQKTGLPIPLVTRQQQYRGVGRVLVARLVVESYRQGGTGKVRVHARPGVELFYRKIGFRNVPHLSHDFVLDEADAETLLQGSLLSEAEGE